MSPVQVRPPLPTRTTRARTGPDPTTKDNPVAKATDVRPKITLACAECKNRNYITKKNRRNDPDRIELSKFCPTCGKHTEHKETR